jgi:hypothetical protein
MAAAATITARTAMAAIAATHIMAITDMATAATSTPGNRRSR